MKIRPVRADLFHADRRTDKHDEASGRFLQILRKYLITYLTASTTPLMSSIYF
jgi:hypothetical protein